MNSITRRSFLTACAIATASLSVSTALSGCQANKMSRSRSQVHFSHGVASGDPSSSAVIIWTRAVPSVNTTTANIDKTVYVDWEVARDEEFTQIVRSGQSLSSPTNDYTVKIDVQGLQAATLYYFRFLGADNMSLVGRTKTLPVGDIEGVKLAVFSCSNYPAGYFNAYAEAAKDPSIDAVLHLGDYIYEYAMGGYATDKAASIGRALASDNDTEIVLLADYRKRYALYRTDQGLQDLHASAPFIVVWDDHEVTNDTYKNGAQNHNPEEGEGDFLERRVAAIRAYYEWLPIRPPKGNQHPQIYRQFEFGNLLSLYMLDTRIIGRDRQLAYADYTNTDTKAFDTQRFISDLTDNNRSLLGGEQFNWLSNAIRQSPSKWQVLGQQVLMGKMRLPTEVFGSGERNKIPDIIDELAQIQTARLNGEPVSETDLARVTTKMSYNLDAWDGYPVEREKLFAICEGLQKPLLVLAGDTHNAWHCELTNQQGKKVGYELATPAVSSPGMEYYLNTDDERSTKIAKQLPLLIDDLKYCNLHQRGYLNVYITPQDVSAQWVFIDNISSPNYLVSNTHKVKLS